MNGDMRCLAASGQLGYGIPEAAYQRGLEREPAFIGADMGSIDPGPYCLGSGNLVVAGESLRHDLELVLVGAHELGVPLLIGSAGTAGAAAQVHTVAELIDTILGDLGIEMDGALIAGDVPADLVRQRLVQGRVTPFGGAPELLDTDPVQCTGLVAQMGVEPFQRALEGGAQLVLAGRSCDTSMFAAIPLQHGYDPGLVMHLAKLIECTSGCAEPGGRDAALGTLRAEDFIVESLDPAKRCTPLSVAAHSLYEQADPFLVGAPGGYLDVTTSRYEQLDERRTRVTGSTWVPSEEYAVKLEGARPRGYRCIALCGIRDPRMIAEIDAVVAATEEKIAQIFADRSPADGFQVRFLPYGRDGIAPVLGNSGDSGDGTPREMLVLIDVVGADRDISRAVCGVAKQYFLHLPYQGILCTSGNCAIPFSPDVIEVGDVYEFNVHHLMELDDPHEVFPATHKVFGRRRVSPAAVRVP